MRELVIFKCAYFAIGVSNGREFALGIVGVFPPATTRVCGAERFAVGGVGVGYSRAVGIAGVYPFFDGRNAAHP